MVSNVSTTLQQSIAAKCTQDANLTNAFTCSEANINYMYIEQAQIGEFLFKCTQNLESVISAKNELQTFIDQQTKAKTKDVILAILMAIGAIIVLIIIAALVKSRMAKSPPPR